MYSHHRITARDIASGAALEVVFAAPEVPMLARLGATPFVIVEVETTGVYARGRDLVIEAAVIRFRPDAGEIEDECVTLVNPKRDIGPTRIHAGASPPGFGLGVEITCGIYRPRAGVAILGLLG